MGTGQTPISLFHFIPFSRSTHACRELKQASAVHETHASIYTQDISKETTIIRPTEYGRSLSFEHSGFTKILHFNQHLREKKKNRRWKWSDHLCGLIYTFTALMHSDSLKSWVVLLCFHTVYIQNCSCIGFVSVGHTASIWFHFDTQWI